MNASALRCTLVVGGLALQGCAASRAVAPLEQGQHAITLSMGGPFVQFAGAPIPAPITAVGYRYGIDGHTDVHAALYLTQLALFRVGGFDLGVARELVTADGGRPRVMVDLNTSWFFGDLDDGGPEGGFRFFPDLSVITTWDMPAREGKRPHRFYLGINNFFQGHPSFRYVFSPLFGAEWRAHDQVGIQLEAQWNAPWVNTQYLQPVWYGPGNQGAAAVKLGLHIYVPGTRRMQEGR